MDQSRWKYTVTSDATVDTAVNTIPNKHFIAFTTLASGTATITYRVNGSDNYEGGVVVDLTAPITYVIEAPVDQIKIVPAGLPGATDYVATIIGTL